MGDGVNIAANMEGIAQPGAICLSEDAYRQSGTRPHRRLSTQHAAVVAFPPAIARSLKITDTLAVPVPTTSNSAWPAD